MKHFKEDQENELGSVNVVIATALSRDTAVSSAAHVYAHPLVLQDILCGVDEFRGAEGIDTFYRWPQSIYWAVR